MYISENTKKFIKENYQLIKDYNFTKLYKLLGMCCNEMEVSGLTQVLYEAGYKPLSYFDGMIPRSYAYDWKDCPIKIFIPNNITDIGAYAFCGSELEEVIFPLSIENIGLRAFSGTLIKQVSLHNKVEIIGDKAFAGCELLEEVFLPNSLDEMGDSIFEGCKNLHKVYYDGTADKFIEVMSNTRRNACWCLGSEIKEVVCLDETLYSENGFDRG